MNETNVVVDPIPTGCQVCGRRDETVRYVVYPYVVSLIVVTFQRAFSGCWCRVHRLPRWLAATLISSILGWFGFPFGLLFTPISLLQLARGGIEDKNFNGRILRWIGEEKYGRGDMQGAIRCFEASLLYVDAPEINEQLRALYRSQSTGSEFLTSGLSSLFVFPAIAIIFGGIAIFVGLVDFLVQWGSSFIATEFPIYVVIVLQVPFVILVFFCIVFLSQIFQSAIRFTRSDSLLFLIFASIVIVLLFFNGITAGEAFGSYLSYIINGFQESWSDTWTTLGAILTRGGFYIFRPSLFSTNLAGTMLFAGLMLVSIIFSLLVLLPRVRDLSSQYARRKQLQSTGGQLDNVNSLPGWTGLAGVVLITVLLFVATPQKTSVDTLEAFDHIGLAFGHVNSGELDQAISEHKLAMELKPDYPYNYVWLGYVYYYKGDFDQAKTNFQKALDLDPGSIEAQAGFGWVFFEEGDLESAEMRFQNVLQIDPANLDAHLGMGWIYLDQSKLQESQQEFEGVIAVAPDLPGAHLGMGSVFFASNDYDSALDSLMTATQLDPNFVLAHVYMGNIYLWQDHYSNAERAFQNALRIQPENYDALAGLGQLHIYTYRFSEGMEYYDQAIKIDSSRSEALIGKVAALSQMGEFVEAASIAESMDPENELTQPILAYVYYQLNRKSDADQLLREADERAGQRTGIEQARAYLAIAGTHSSLYQFPEAQKYLQLAEDSYPVNPDPDFYITSAYLFSALGEFDEAEAVLQQVAQIGHSDIALSLARASLMIDQQDLANAEREIQSALQIDKNSANAHALMSFVLNLNGDFEKAIQEAQEAVQLNRHNGGAYTNLAFAYQSIGRTDDAILMAREALRHDALNGLAHYFLGVSYMEKGMNTEAITEFGNFLDTYWDRAYIRDFKLKAEEYLTQLNQIP